MFNAIMTGLMGLIATLIQIICWPINQTIMESMPDLSEKLVDVSNGFTMLFDNIGWALGLLPTGILEVLTFIISIEIVKHTVFISTHTLTKVWNILGKIKFW